jgi:hypothetical protein
MNIRKMRKYGLFLYQGKLLVRAALADDGNMDEINDQSCEQCCVTETNCRLELAEYPESIQEDGPRGQPSGSKTSARH